MPVTLLLSATLLLRSIGITPDPWFGEDKLKHFVTSFVVTSLTASGARLAGADSRASLYLGSGIMATAGLYKEIQDARAGGAFSYRDIVWNFGGIAAAGVVLDSAR